MSEVDDGDRLVAAELRAALGDRRIGSDIVVVEETRSTNDLAWAAADRGAPEGFAIFAERQTAGRGQYGRRWESAPYQGIAMSILLRPAITLRESPRLTSLLAEAIAAAITEETGCPAVIKPPNDIYVEQRKVAGVLVEGRTAADGRYVAVAGIGINVNQTLADFPEELRSTAGSLAIASGRRFNRNHLAIALLARLEDLLADACHPERSRGTP